MKNIVWPLAVVFTLVAAPASAQLVGTTISEEYRYPNLATPASGITYTPQSFVVGSGTESTIDAQGLFTFKIDFSSSSLLVDIDTTASNPSFIPSSFNGIVFTGSGLSQFNTLSIGAATNVPFFDLSHLTLVGDSLRLNLAGLGVNNGSRLAVNFASVSSPAVPEPSTWLTMIVGFGLVGVSMRRLRFLQKAAIRTA